MNWKEIVENTMKHFINMGKTAVSIGEIKLYLLTNYNIRSLNYTHIERNILRNFVETAELLGFGRYDASKSIFYLNTQSGENEN